MLSCVSLKKSRNGPIGEEAWLVDSSQSSPDRGASDMIDDKIVSEEINREEDHSKLVGNRKTSEETKGGHLKQIYNKFKFGLKHYFNSKKEDPPAVKEELEPEESYSGSTCLSFDTTSVCVSEIQNENVSATSLNVIFQTAKHSEEKWAVLEVNSDTNMESAPGQNVDLNETVEDGSVSPFMTEINAPTEDDDVQGCAGTKAKSIIATSADNTEEATGSRMASTPEEHVPESKTEKVKSRGMYLKIKYKEFKSGLKRYFIPTMRDPQTAEPHVVPERSDMVTPWTSIDSSYLWISELNQIKENSNVESNGTDLKFTSSSLDSPSITQIRLDKNEVSECVSEEQESDVKLEGCDLNSICPSLDSSPICSNEPDQTEENLAGSNSSPDPQAADHFEDQCALMEENIIPNTETSPRHGGPLPTSELSEQAGPSGMHLERKKTDNSVDSDLTSSPTTTEIESSSEEDDKDDSRASLTVGTNSCVSDRINKEPARKHSSKLHNTTSKQKKLLKYKKVQLAVEDLVDKSSDLTSDSSYSRETSSSKLAHTSDDMRDESGLDLCFVPVKYADNIKNEKISQSETRPPSDLPPTASSDPAKHFRDENFTVELGLITDVASTPTINLTSLRTSVCSIIDEYFADLNKE